MKAMRRPHLSENDQNQNDAAQAETAAGAATEPEQETQEEPKVSFTTKAVEDQPGSVKRFTVEVERAQYDAKLDEILGDLNKTVVVEGFRRGKAPLRLLRNRFGKEAQEDAVRGIAENISRQLILENALNPIGEAEIAESKAEENAPVEIKIDIEIQPQIDPIGYTGLDIEVEAEAPSDDKVERQLEIIRDANATYETAPGEKPLEKGDGATVDIEVKDEAGNRVENQCQENLFLRDPMNSLPEDIAKEIAGKKAGDVLTKEIVRHGQSKTGKEITHKSTTTVTIKEIKTKVLPALDDEFAKDVGDFENLAALRKRILDDMTQQQERAKRSQAMSKIFDKVMEQMSFDAPRRIVAAQVYQTINRDTRRLEQMGIDLSALGQSTEGYLQNARQNSERMVKMGMLINAIAEKEHLEVTDEDINKEIDRQAEESGRKPLAVRARLEAEKRLDDLKEQLLGSKVEEFLMANNSIQVVEPKPKAQAPSDSAE